MKSLQEFGFQKQLQQAVDELTFDQATPIQEEAYPVVLSGKDVVGIAQTGTGKTFAYLLPLLHQYRYSKENHPSIVILVPTRELVLQVVEQAKLLGKYLTARIHGVYGGVNMNTQAEELVDGVDILVGTPGRMYDLVVSRSIQLKRAKKIVIDEVDVMLEMGFRPQLNNLFDWLPEKRQHIMFSATMTTEVDTFIHKYFFKPVTVAIAVSGTPLENIRQVAYPAQNFYTKLNLLRHLLRNKAEFVKVLVFTASKKHADLVAELLDEDFHSELCVVHSNKSQNYRIRSVRQFEEGEKRILITTDIMARGLDLTQISHVINYDTPEFPENYMHRIGRTGRAEESGNSILFYTPKEEDARLEIEMLMDYEIPTLDFPDEVQRSSQLLPEERPRMRELSSGPRRKKKEDERGASFHEKKAKNQKKNLGGPQKRKLEAKYKKPKTRGDKNFRQGKKNKKRW